MSDWIPVSKRTPCGPGFYTVRVGRSKKEYQAWFLYRKGGFVTPDGAAEIPATHWRIRYGMGLSLGIDQIVESLTKAKKLIHDEEPDESKVRDLIFAQLQAAHLLEEWREQGEKRAKKVSRGR